MKIGVVINQTAADKDQSIPRQVQSAFAEHALQAEVLLARGPDLVTAAQQLLEDRVAALIAGGGDGTISTIAEICVREQIPLGVLPLGTRNHFVRDLRFPSSTSESVASIATRLTRRVDVGSVNGRIFINNSSVGAYPRAVEQREELRDRFGLRKHIAGVIATLRTFAQRPIINATIELDGNTTHCTTPFIFVGNNAYTIHLFAVQFRSSLSDGQLCVYTTRANGIRGLLHLLWLSLWNRLDQSRDFEMHCGSQALIHLHQPCVRVSRDGEVSRMNTPLLYQIKPAALEVFAPGPQES
jgi:diacylglycerol kinase family enzyme